MVNASDESAIRQIIEARAKAVRAGDVDAMVANVADDVVMFDVIDLSFAKNGDGPAAHPAP